MPERLCPVCGDPVQRKGPTGRLPTYCGRGCQQKAHGQRFPRTTPTRHGGPYNVPVAPRDRLPLPGETILSRANAPDYLIDEAGCWVWQKQLLRGYPATGQRKGHILYWERANGRAVPTGWHVHHKCENRACVNPDHLEAKPADRHRQDHGLERTGLTRDDIAAIRELVADPRNSHERIAEQYGIARVTVTQIASGARWGFGPVELKPRPCEVCGEPVEGKRRNGRYCSKSCKEKARYQRAKAARA